MIHGDRHHNQLEMAAEAEAWEAELQQCACSHCTVLVHPDEYTFPWCTRCYLNIDGKCD